MVAFILENIANFSYLYDTWLLLLIIGISYPLLGKKWNKKRRNNRLYTYIFLPTIQDYYLFFRQMQEC